jgi:hypothetical protein
LRQAEFIAATFSRLNLSSRHALQGVFVVKMQRGKAMRFRFSNLTYSSVMILAMFLTIGCIWSFAQSSPAPLSKNTDPLVTEEQNETFRDTLKKMQIKREEEEHKKLLRKAEQIKTDAGALQKEVSGEKLRRDADKLLREIEKNARHLRSESGGGNNDHQLESVPDSLESAVSQLVESGEKLQTAMSKTSRHVVSAAVITHATDVLLLVKILRGYLVQS